MNYAAVINGPFSGNNNNSRLGYVHNGHGQQMEVMGQHSLMAAHGRSFNSGPAQPMNIYNQFVSVPTTKNPRVNIHVGSKLFVGQVPAMVTEELLRPVFEPYGELLEVKIMRDSLGRSKGSAWVRYETNEMAMNAINALHEKRTVPPQTNPLRVQFAASNTGRHYQYRQQQQQAMYPIEFGDSMNQYNAGASIAGAAQKGGPIMVPPDASPNGILPTTGSIGGNGGRHVSSDFAGRGGGGGGGGGGGSMETLPISAEPYTFSANRFSNVNAPGTRRNVCPSFEQQQPTTAQLYSQQRSAFSPFFGGPPSTGTQPFPLHVTMNRGGNNSNSNGTRNMAPTMQTE